MQVQQQTWLILWRVPQRQRLFGVVLIGLRWPGLYIPSINHCYDHFGKAMTLGKAALLRRGWELKALHSQHQSTLGQQTLHRKRIWILLSVLTTLYPTTSVNISLARSNPVLTLVCTGNWQIVIHHIVQHWQISVLLTRKRRNYMLERYLEV